MSVSAIPCGRGPTLYLHIGAGKTGTTAIQAALARNALVLAQRGVLVPDQELRIGGAVTGTQLNYFETMAAADVQAIGDVSGRLLSHTHHRAVVVSAENLINRRSFATLFKPLTEVFDIRVVAYVRRQDDWLRAAWSQWGFRKADFRTWLGESPLGEVANWWKILTAWHAELGGESKLIVRVFDRAALVGGDVVRDFFSAIGESTVGLALDGKSINPTLNDVGLRVAARNPDLISNIQDNRFLDFLRAVDIDGVTERIAAWGATERRALMQLYNDGNERLRARYLPYLKDLFPPVEDDGPAYTDAQYRDAELALLWRALFRIWDSRSGPNQPPARSPEIRRDADAVPDGRSQPRAEADVVVPRHHVARRQHLYPARSQHTVRRGARRVLRPRQPVRATVVRLALDTFRQPEKA
jgi:hypothetical protein